MSDPVVIVGEVRQGRLLPFPWAKLLEALGKFADGTRIRITIEIVKKLRSNQQNRYYWKVLVRRVRDVLRAFGNDCDDDNAHQYVKQEILHLTTDLHMPDGEIVTVPGSTAKLGTIEFSDACEQVRAWLAEQGVIAPLPNEVL